MPTPLARVRARSRYPGVFALAWFRSGVPPWSMSMAFEWYYGRGTEIFGPISERALSSMAVDGSLLRSDTVWRSDTTDGVPASRVRNLFPPDPNAIGDGDPSDMAVEPAAELPAPKEPRPARATAGRGAVLMGQDGKNVRYRGKCKTCGREEAGWKSIAIPRGTFRGTFFCAKCRKKSDVEISGYH